ncbi:P-type conjugative transfer protein TrbG [Pseudoxanthomonas suwonensis]|uniref:Conjugal transfer protein TrbG n=1 Tax=Pseudoxanthomonas suwonensis TaxID=314722 RepID=A0A0E3UMG4_9GAMM|nr:P-type conjugative transfer protein TrbG [Pseudoxanthomonas suwonensis]AKC86311.1 conjugal transfer protein TrbG [Pseudoxanthomonas suwonensis]
MNVWLRIAVLPLGLVLAGCASSAKKPPAIALDEPVSEVAEAEPDTAAAEAFAISEAMRWPRQWKPLPVKPAPKVEPANVQNDVVRALNESRVPPVREGFVNATQVWPFVEGALYQVYGSPGRVTLIALQPGEQLVTMAAGDTVRWIVGDTVSGSGGEQRVSVLVKPTRPDLQTNLVITTDRRTYLVELSSTEQTWMASVSWDYPQDRMRALQRRAQEAQPATQVGLPLQDLRFRYAITGANAPWRPRHAFDDGRKVYIQFPAGIAQGELPPLFVVGPHGEGQLVNYRYLAPYYVVDRLFGAAELRLGGDRAEVVRIERTDRVGRR